MLTPHYTIITGASEGFGKALAMECARHRMNLILVALPGPELHTLAHFIRRNYGVHVIMIEKDLCHDTGCVEVYHQVMAMKLRVNILINNAGIGSTVFFEEGTIHLYEQQIKLNVLATTLMTKLFLDLLKDNKHSHILNVASMAAFFHLPKKHVYGATKSFVYSFSKSIRKELKKDGVHVSVLCPGGMNTNLPLTLMNRTASWLARKAVMNPEDAGSVAIYGMLKRRAVIIPGIINRSFIVLDKILPNFIKKILLQKAMKNLDQKNHLTRYLQQRPVVAGA